MSQDNQAREAYMQVSGTLTYIYSMGWEDTEESTVHGWNHISQFVSKEGDEKRTKGR